MADAVTVFPPGFRLTDSTTGAAMSGAVIRFYDAGTTTPKTVYADAALSTSVGTYVTTDSLGYPTSDGGGTKSLIYLGTASYKITMEDSGGSVFATHDNVKGAIDVVSPDDLTIVATRPVLIKSTGYTILAADQSSVFSVNCSAGDVLLTLPSAVTVGDGWFITVQHSGSANQVRVTTVSSQTIASGAASYAQNIVLSYSGEEISIVSDGGNWRCYGHTPPHFKSAQGIITVVDRLSAPPGGEVEGSVYLLTSSPSGDWSSFSEHDLVQYTSSAWVRFAPREGWQVWVADEDATYRFDGSSWLSNVASDTQAGIVEYAVQSEMEAASSTTLAVTPGRQKYHPLNPKAWVLYNHSSATITSDVGVSSVSDNGLGNFTVTMDTAFSDATYAHVAAPSHSQTSGATCLKQLQNGTISTTQNQWICGRGDDESNFDGQRQSILYMGDWL
jgi:hypothetical protein